MEGGTDWFVNEADKELINKLLLARILGAGICRVCRVSLPWLLAYVKELCAALPDDLNAELCLPALGLSLNERPAAELTRLAAVKKPS